MGYRSLRWEKRKRGEQIKGKEKGVRLPIKDEIRFHIFI